MSQLTNMEFEQELQFYHFTVANLQEAVFYVTDRQSISPIAGWQLVKPGSRAISCIVALSHTNK